MSKWNNVPLKYVYTGLYDGVHGTPQPADEGPVFLGIKNITEDGRIDLSDIRHIAEEDFPKWTKRVLPRTNDIIFSYEATLNRYAIIGEGFKGCLGRRLGLIRPNLEIINPKFLYYYFFSKEWRSVVQQNVNIGSTVDRIPLSQMPEFPISIPDKNTQNKIASILSAYDDLIENNLRRIKILEEMAQRIYQEWFVHFRFPGHETVKMVESELGLIPEGWLGCIGDLYTIHSGFAFKSSDMGEAGNYGIVKIRNIQQGSIDIKSVANLTCKPSMKMMEYVLNEGDVLIAMTGAQVGKVGVMPRSNNSYLLNQRVGTFRSLKKCMQKHCYIIQVVNSQYFQQQVKNLAQGAAQPNISGSFIESIPCIVPSNELLIAFEKKVNAIMEMTLILEYKNGNLCKTRDLLLPRLISGELDVENLDIVIPEDNE